MYSRRYHGVFAVVCALVLTGLAGCALLSNMIVSPASLDFGQAETSKTFNVSFSGASLVWAVAVDPAAASWLSVSPASGRGAATVTVTVNRNALPAASNMGNITVTDQNRKSAVVQVSAAKASDGGNGGGGNVPNVVGQSQAAAEAAITAAGLTVGTVTQQCSDSVAKGNVISQNPAGGAAAAAGTSVSLVVSSGPCGGGGSLEGKWYWLSLTYDEEMEAVKSVGYLGSMTFQGNSVEYAITYTYPQEEKGLSEEAKEVICSEGYFVRGTYSTDTAAGQIDLTFTEDGGIECCGDSCDEETYPYDEPELYYGIFMVSEDGNLVLSANTTARPGSFEECYNDGPYYVYILIPESRLANYPYWDGEGEFFDTYWADCEKGGPAVQKMKPLDRFRGLFRAVMSG